MKKVKILLSGNAKLQYYVDAVNSVGAEATAVYLPKIDTSYDGLILCGGNDIHPKYYNEELNGSVNIDNARDEVEFKLLKAYVEAGKPVLGICRGYQLINAYFDGSLYQHIPEFDLHISKGSRDSVHNVEAIEGSVISRLYGELFSVNSSHHQAINKLGNGLVATAFWNGKYVEAFEHKALHVIGVQWHPERMCLGQKRIDTVDGAILFEYFVSLCKEKTILSNLA